MKIKYVFIVLHYSEKALLDTFECVESLLKLKEEKRIIVVENGSNDDSNKKLQEKYEKNNYVECIYSTENLGFARGNNLGCNYAREKYNPDYLIVLNNDTYIIQEDFLEKLDQKAKSKDYDIIGPYIYDRNLKPQNPVLNLKTEISEVEKQLEYIDNCLNKRYKKNKLKQHIKLILNSNKLGKFILRNLLRRNTKLLKISKKEIGNVGLHGSCLIFTKKYFKQYKDIFYPATFLYMEEDILYNRVLKDKLKSVYFPEIEIYHKEDKSTEALYGVSEEKEKFILSNIKKSAEIYLKLLKDEKI